MDLSDTKNLTLLTMTVFAADAAAAGGSASGENKLNLSPSEYSPPLVADSEMTLVNGQFVSASGGVPGASAVSLRKPPAYMLNGNNAGGGRPPAYMLNGPHGGGSHHPHQHGGRYGHHSGMHGGGSQHKIAKAINTAQSPAERNANEQLDSLMRAKKCKEAWVFIQNMLHVWRVRVNPHLASLLLKKSMPKKEFAYNVSNEGGRGTLPKHESNSNTNSTADRMILKLGLEIITTGFLHIQAKDVDEILLNSVFDGYSRLKSRDALSKIEGLLAEMEPKWGIHPSAVTFGIVMRAFGNGGDVARSINLFRQMTGYGIVSLLSFLLVLHLFYRFSFSIF